jgi:hypothetical protein
MSYPNDSRLRDEFDHSRRPTEVELTSKRLKLHLVLGRSLYLISLVALGGCVYFIGKNYETGMMGVLLEIDQGRIPLIAISTGLCLFTFIGGIVWTLVTRIRAWWRHG